MGFLTSAFTGGGGNQSSSTSTTNSTQNTDYTPQYDAYVNNILSQAQALGNTPFPAYDVNSMFAPFNATQNQAFSQVGANQNSYMPYINSATGALNSAQGYNPVSAAQPYFNGALNTPTAYQAGSPYVAASAQGWNPQSAAAYTNPFLGGALGYSTQLAQQNLMENVLPGINDSFVKSGGGLGGNRNQDFLARATRDFNNAQIGQYNTAAANNYWQGANQFNTDQSRMLSAGQNLGSLANQTQGTLGTLGTQAAGVQGQGITGATGLANAYSGLGGALSNLGLTNTNALLQVGNQQQQQAQQPLTAGYNQFQQAVQWPFQLVNFMNSAQRGLQIPTTTTTNSTTNATQTGSSESSPSAAGGILGTLGGLNSIFGTSANSQTGQPAQGGLSNIWNGLSSWFGGFGGSGGFGGGVGGTAPKTGGYIDEKARLYPAGPSGRSAGVLGSRRGEPTPRRYAIGGSVPVTKGILSQSGPSQRALMGTQGRPPQMGGGALPMGPAMGPAIGGMPMPRPIAAGALRGMGAR